MKTEVYMKYMTLFSTEGHRSAYGRGGLTTHVGSRALTPGTDAGDRDKKGKILDFPGGSVKNPPANGFDP